MHAPRLAVAAAVAGIVVAGGAGPAAAHVSVTEPVAAGGISEVVLTVPNERDDAATVALEVKLPEDHPLPLVSLRVKPGWKSDVTMRTLDEPVELFGREVTEVVDTVRWTGGAVQPGEYDTFTLRAGPFPDDLDELALPTIQTYDSGEEVAWIELAEEGGEEPAHPAPVVRVEAGTAAVTGGDGTGDAPAEEGGGTDPLAVAALALSVGATGLAGAALVRGERGRDRAGRDVRDAPAVP